MQLSLHSWVGLGGQGEQDTLCSTRCMCLALLGKPKRPLPSNHHLQHLLHVPGSAWWAQSQHQGGT